MCSCGTLAGQQRTKPNQGNGEMTCHGCRFSSHPATSFQFTFQCLEPILPEVTRMCSSLTHTHIPRTMDVCAIGIDGHYPKSHFPRTHCCWYRCDADPHRPVPERMMHPTTHTHTNTIQNSNQNRANGKRAPSRCAAKKALNVPPFDVRGIPGESWSAGSCRLWLCTVW